MKNLIFTLLFLSIGHLSFGQVYTGFKTLNSGQNMTLNLVVDVPANSVEITMTGPINKYNAVGFGGFNMTNRYTIVATGGGAISERKLGNHNGGSALANSLTSQNYSTSGGIATTVVTRALNGMNGDYFTFPSTAGSISIIWAIGNNSNFGNHNSRSSTTIVLTEECTNTTSTITTASCDSYTSPSGDTYMASGTYMDMIPNAAGCDSTITINLTIDPSYNLNQNGSVCSGGSYTFPDGSTQNNITSQVVQTSNLTTAQTNCDSTIVTTVSVNPTYNQQANISVCSGQSHTFPDGTTIQDITMAFDQTSVLATQNEGCDSTIVTSVSISPVVNISEAGAVCSGGSYTFPDGTTMDNITTAVNQTSNLPGTGNDCDSVIVTTVSVNEIYNIMTPVELCSGEAYSFPDGSIQTNITADVEQTSALTSTEGCDSTVVTSITVMAINMTTEAENVCAGESYTFPDGSVQDDITSDVIYTSIIDGVGGECDSTIVTNLTVIETDNGITTSDATLTANAPNASYVWINCDTNEPIDGETMASFTVSVSGNYAVEVTLNGCTVTSDCINVEIVSTNNVYSDLFKVYPSLTDGTVYIENNNFSSKLLSIEIFDTKGQVTQTLNNTLTNKMQFEIEGQSGIYFIKIMSDKKSAVYKIYKN